MRSTLTSIDKPIDIGTRPGTNPRGRRITATDRATPLNRTSAARQRAGDGLILAVCFGVFLLIAMFGQVLGLNWRAWFPGAEGHSSLFGSIKSAAYSVLPLLG